MAKVGENLGLLLLRFPRGSGLIARIPAHGGFFVGVS
jgi:hypothetical protein